MKGNEALTMDERINNSSISESYSAGSNDCSHFNNSPGQWSLEQYYISCKLSRVLWIPERGKCSWNFMRTIALLIGLFSALRLDCHDASSILRVVEADSWIPKSRSSSNIARSFIETGHPRKRERERENLLGRSLWGRFKNPSKQFSHCLYAYGSG